MELFARHTKTGIRQNMSALVVAGHNLCLLLHKLEATLDGKLLVLFSILFSFAAWADCPEGSLIRAEEDKLVCIKLADIVENVCSEGQVVEAKDGVISCRDQGVYSSAPVCPCGACGSITNVTAWGYQECTTDGWQSKQTQSQYMNVYFSF